MRRILGLTAVTIASLALPAGASAAITGVFGGHTMNGQPIPCESSNAVRLCTGDVNGVAVTDLRLKSFDGTPLALYVTLPSAPASGTDGRYPLVVQSHGWGAPPSGPNDRQYGGPTATEWASKGYAVLQLTARGWGNSCGKVASRTVNPAACAKGYIRLGDMRYEVRDVQNAVGLLVDAGIADPKRVGVMGDSYGGGISLDLATLKDRVMQPNGSLKPWKSPRGTPVQIAAAAPWASFSDLIYALAPNGRTADGQITPETTALSPVGVQKSTIMGGLFGAGQVLGYYAPTGTDPSADLISWLANVSAGEPYTTAKVQSMMRQIAQFRSSYYLLRGTYGTKRVAPAPLHLANGFTDDIFPVDENLRYYDYVRSKYPSNPITLFAFDGGHPRGQNKAADGARLAPRVLAFFDRYVKRTKTRAPVGVTALTQTCPIGAPSGGPYTAATWAGLHPGKVTYSGTRAQTIISTAGDTTISGLFDPVVGGLACTTATATDQGAGVATYRLPAATGSGYTLLGSPAITANLKATGKYPYIAARLLDVNPVTNTETLVARGLYRLDTKTPNGRKQFELHPGAWRFVAGHVPKLELLGQDSPYARPSNGVFRITVSNLQLRLPVHEVAGARGTPPAVKKY